MEADSRATLADAIDRLPDRWGRVLRLAFLDDEREYTVPATTVRMPVGSIGPTRQRALRRMRDLLISTEIGELESA